jgi:hypothetical protein
MPWFAQLLRDYGILVVFAAIWLVGAIANGIKAAKKARERAEAATRRPDSGPSRAEHAPERARAPAQPSQQSAQDVAREMRRILGIETADDEERRAPREASREPTDVAREHEAGDRSFDVPDAPPPRPRPEAPPPLPSRRRNTVEPERVPVPVVPTTSGRRLTIHVDPHVGESIQRRATPRSGKVGEHAAGTELGRLGGRVQRGVGGGVAGRRYALDDLKRVIVLSEILGPPLALRPPRDREL